MLPEAIKKPNLAPVNDIIAQARGKILNFTIETLPKVADGAQRAGESLGDAARAAGQHTADALRTIRPASGAAAGAAMFPASTLRRALGFAGRRPVITLLGGAVVLGACAALLRRRRDEAETPEDPS
jgi:hypothetical protein